MMGRHGDTRAMRNAFWRDLGQRSFALFLGAVFFTFASLGFLVDVLALGRQSLSELIYTTLVTGLVSVSYAWCGTRARKWFPVAILGQNVLLSITPTLFPATGRQSISSRSGSASRWTSPRRSPSSRSATCCSSCSSAAKACPR